jgi:hypothetical protein
MQRRVAGPEKPPLIDGASFEGVIASIRLRFVRGLLAKEGNMRRVALTLVVFLLPIVLAGQEAKNEGKIKPNAKALEKRFKILSERFDADKRRYAWVLEATITSEEPCHFDGEFQDSDEKQVTTVAVEFEDGGKRTEKGDKYRAYLKYPIRKTMEKVTQIVIRKSDS